MPRKTGLNPPVIVTGRPKVVLSLRFICFMFDTVQFLKVLINTSVCPICLVQ